MSNEDLENPQRFWRNKHIAHRDLRTTFDQRSNSQVQRTREHTALSTTTIAALYVQPDGCYANLPGVEVWDQARDARTYAGPYPVVAHPPCQLWGRFGSHIAAARSWPEAGDGSEPTDTAVHLWAAGCDMETARFAAMMLERSGLVLMPKDSAPSLSAGENGR